MIKEKLKGKDLLLILLYLPGMHDDINEPISGRTRLTKMIFLFEKEIYKNFDNIIEEDSLPDFFAYDYGPFSKDLLDDLRFFKIIGFIQEKITERKLSVAETAEYYYAEIDDMLDEQPEIVEVPIYEVEFSLTEKGINYVKNNILSKFTEKQIEILKKFKRKINSLSLNEILAYVYNKYTETTKKSKIKEKYLNKRGDIID